MKLYCKDYRVARNAVRGAGTGQALSLAFYPICGAPIEYSGRGPHPQYCESCRKIHYWERLKKYRQSERGREKRREQVRRYNQTENGKASRKAWWTTAEKLL